MPVNMINCSADCIYQKEGCCCLDFISAVSGLAKEGCHYYKQTETVLSQKEEKKSLQTQKQQKNFSKS